MGFQSNQQVLIPPQFAIPVTTKTNWTVLPPRRKKHIKTNTTIWRFVSPSKIPDFTLSHVSFFFGGGGGMYSNILQHLHFFVPWPAVARLEKSFPVFDHPFFLRTQLQNQPDSPYLQQKKHITWLVVEPTHLKIMLVKTDASSPMFGVKIKNIFQTTT